MAISVLSMLSYRYACMLGLFEEYFNVGIQTGFCTDMNGLPPLLDLKHSSCCQPSTLSNVLGWGMNSADVPCMFVVKDIRIYSAVDPHISECHGTRPNLGM